MNLIPRWLATLFILMILVLLVGGVLFFRAQEQQLRGDVESSLAAIAQLKADQIAQWLTARVSDAAVLMESPFLSEALVDWMKKPQPEAREAILTRFRSLQKHYGYSDVLLVDARGNVRLSLSGRTGAIEEETVQDLSAAFREGRPRLTELHAGPEDLPVHVEAIAPFYAGEGETAGPVGAILLRSDARDFLYPLVQSWSTPSRSAETMLIRHDGDDFLFLNELRHERDTALKRRMPLKHIKALGEITGKGVTEEEDYRGVEVLSVLKSVPDSSWLMIAKIDKAEALAGWRSRSMLILALILGFLAAAGASAGVVWQRYTKAAAMIRAERALRAGEERYRPR
jgi:hypothetical protein